MQKLLALTALTFLLGSCSEVPEAVVAAEPEAPIRPVEKAFALMEPLEYDSPTPDVIRGSEGWSADTAGLSSRVVALLRRLDDGVTSAPVDPQCSVLYRVPGPRNASLYFYLQRTQTYDSGRFVIFLESATGGLTAQPVSFVNQRSRSGAPDIRLVDLDRDGVQEVVASDYFHNGTALNLWVDNYWEVGADLSLQPVLKVARSDESTQVEAEGFGNLSRRLLHGPTIEDSPSYILEVVWAPEPAGTPQHIIGYVALNFDAQSRKWREVPVAPEGLAEHWVEELSPLGTHANLGD